MEGQHLEDSKLDLIKIQCYSGRAPRFACCRTACSLVFLRSFLALPTVLTLGIHLVTRDCPLVKTKH